MSRADAVREDFFHADFKSALVLPPKTDIWVAAKISASTGLASVNYEIILVDA